MDYYETTRSLIHYLNNLVSHDHWRLKFDAPTKIVVVLDLYKILLDVLSEHVNPRYANLLDIDVRGAFIILDETNKTNVLLFSDKEALRYIYIVYFLYTQLSSDSLILWRLRDKICDIIRRGKYEP